LREGARLFLDVGAFRLVIGEATVQIGFRHFDERIHLFFKKVVGAGQDLKFDLSSALRARALNHGACFFRRTYLVVFAVNDDAR